MRSRRLILCPRLGRRQLSRRPSPTFPFHPGLLLNCSSCFVPFSVHQPIRFTSAARPCRGGSRLWGPSVRLFCKSGTPRPLPKVFLGLAGTAPLSPHTLLWAGPRGGERKRLRLSCAFCAFRFAALSLFSRLDRTLCRCFLYRNCKTRNNTRAEAFIHCGRGAGGGGGG